MIYRTRPFVVSLVPLLSSLCLVGCAKDSAGSEDAASSGSITGPTGTPTGAATPSGPTGAVTPVGATGGDTAATGATGPTVVTGSSGAASSAPAQTVSGTSSGTSDTPLGSGSVTGSAESTSSTSGMTGSTGSGTGAAGGATDGPGGSAGVEGGAGGTTAAAGSGGAGTGGTGESTVTGVNVQMNKTRQNIRGFGLNSALMPSDKSLPMDELYGMDGPNAIGLSILRVGMTPDGNLTGGFISEARELGATIIGSTWSPPANCKSNGSTQNGGALLESCYDSWATTIANFAQEYDLYAMSIANESDFASCPGTPVCTDAYDTTVYTANQMVAWVKVAGAKLRDAGIKVIAPEASEWIHVWSNASGTGSLIASHPQSSDPLDCGCFSNTPTEEGCAQKCLEGDGYDYGHWLWADQEAWNAFDILGVHEYDSQMAYAWPADVNDGVRDKEVWQTEMSGVMHWPEQGPSIDIDNGVAVAGWIHSALTIGEASAWLYWWYEAYYQDDNEGLALIQGSSTIAKRYFTLGNYSKFVRPGFFAVEVAGNDNEDVLLSAYTGDEGQVVVVAINKGDAAAEFPITITGGTAPASMTPHVTSASDNLVAGTAVPVADGVFTVSLEPMTVTSFVGE